MLTRYYRDEKGRPRSRAKVYTKNEHVIRRHNIDDDARKICSRLNEKGYQAYIVGGAVRDLLLGFHPKDFDIATSATPTEVKKIFRNSRIIGKRFRLVHIFFDDGKIHEVVTLRALDSGDRNHIYGSIDEDVMRRDFSMNALYYDPVHEQIIDFVGGVKDIENRVLRSVIPLKRSFVEDPVRMLRAVKYAAVSGMCIPSALGLRIKKQSHLMGETSHSRLSEELVKILRSGNSEIIFRFMNRYRLIKPMLPVLYGELQNDRRGRVMEEMFLSLAKLDSENKTNNPASGYMLYRMVYPLIQARGVFDSDKEPDEGNAIIASSRKPDYWHVVLQLKKLLKPLVQPNRDVEEAVRLMFRDQQIHIEKHMQRTVKGRRRRRAGFQGRKHNAGLQR